MDSRLAAELAGLDALGQAALAAAGDVTATELLDAAISRLESALGASLAGAREAMGSRALRTHVAAETAWIVERYLDAGLVVFGKTNTPEWGNSPVRFATAQRFSTG